MVRIGTRLARLVTAVDEETAERIEDLERQLRELKDELAEIRALVPDERVNPPYMGLTEAGEELGVTRQRVAQLAESHPDFPKPVDRIRSGPIFTAVSIRKFSAGWDRTPGRRKKPPTGDEQLNAIFDSLPNVNANDGDDWMGIPRS